MTDAPDEVRQWMSEISNKRKAKRGGRSIKLDTPEAKAKREYMREYRKKKKDKDSPL